MLTELPSQCTPDDINAFRPLTDYIDLPRTIYLQLAHAVQATEDRMRKVYPNGVPKPAQEIINSLTKLAARKQIEIMMQEVRACDLDLYDNSKERIASEMQAARKAMFKYLLLVNQNPFSDIDQMPEYKELEKLAEKHGVNLWDYSS